MTHAADDRAGRRGLARLHAGSGHGNDWHAVRVERCIQIERSLADARRHADAFTQVWEVQDDADDAAVKGLALFRIDRVTDAKHAADIEHLNDVAWLH